MEHLSNSGVLLRGYAKKSEQVPEVVNMLRPAITAAVKVGFPAIIVLIPTDADCGETSPAVLAMVSELDKEGVFANGVSNVSVLPLPGNQNSTVLNGGVEKLRALGMKYAFIVSNKSAPFLVHENLSKIFTAFDEGALITGFSLKDQTLAYDPASEGVLKGLIQNGFAAWDIKALLAIGGFEGEGVEEVAASIKILRNVERPCIAPLYPVNEGTLAVNHVFGDHNKWVSSTKTLRQQAEAERLGESFSFIEAGVMEGYPK